MWWALTGLRTKATCSKTCGQSPCSQWLGDKDLSPIAARNWNVPGKSILKKRADLKSNASLPAPWYYDLLLGTSRTGSITRKRKVSPRTSLALHPYLAHSPKYNVKRSEKNNREECYYFLRKLEGWNRLALYLALRYNRREQSSNILFQA